MNDDLNIGIKVTADTAGATATTAALNDVNKATGNAAEGTKALGKQADQAGDLLKSFGHRGGEAREAFEGIERVTRGGTPSVFGFALAWRALTAAFAANPLTAILIGLVALFGPIKELISRLTEAGESLDDTKERAEKLKGEMALLEEASKKAMEAIASDADKAKKAYGELDAAMAAATHRVDELNKANLALDLAKINQAEQGDLANADTPLKKEEVKLKYQRQREDTQRQYASAGLSDEETNSRLVIDQKQKEANEASQRIAAAKSKAEAAEQEFQNKAALSGEALKQNGGQSKAFKDAYETAQLAKKSAEDARKQADEAATKNQPIIDDATTAIRVAQTNAEVAKVKGQTLTVEKRGSDITRSQQDDEIAAREELQRKATITGTGLEIAATAAARTNTSQTHPETMAALKELRDVGTALKKDATDAEIGAALKDLAEVIKQLGGESPTTKLLKAQLEILKKQIAAIPRTN